MGQLNGSHTLRKSEWYAADFIKQSHLDSEIKQKCERTCLLWSKEHWASEAKRAQVNLQQSKDRTLSQSDITVESIFQNGQFLNAVAQVYGRLFGSPKEFCDVKKFDKCPYINQRQNLRKNGSLTNVFLTLLHKAAMYAMLERHPIDSGLLDEEYDDVFGIDLTNFQDIEAALLDGRFEMMYEAVLKERGKTLELEVTGSTGKAGFRIIVYPPL